MTSAFRCRLASGSWFLQKPQIKQGKTRSDYFDILSVGCDAVGLDVVPNCQENMQPPSLVSTLKKEATVMRPPGALIRRFSLPNFVPL